LSWNLHGTVCDEGDLAELVGLGHKHFIIQLKKDEVLHTHRGKVNHNDLIGIPWGSQIFSHMGSPFFLLQPPLGDLLRDLPRNSQILYPKEIGYILITMGIGPGHRVVEAGTGSGSLTTALAYAVGESGHVFSYEVRPEMQQLAIKNLTRVGLAERVTFKTRDIVEGFDEEGMDALFLDVPNPYDYVLQVRKAVKPGGFFGCILPTMNQVIKLLPVLRRNDFAFVDVSEILLRFYKPEPDRFRPVDRMIAHTGYLIFGRPVLINHEAIQNDQNGDIESFEGREVD
jgi:tRNA (adenine57-N1/adenine58-N1)-methyltransferase catalytic subunit